MAQYFVLESFRKVYIWGKEWEPNRTEPSLVTDLQINLCICQHAFKFLPDTDCGLPVCSWARTHEVLMMQPYATQNMAVADHGELR